jgi:hypothetical protein
MEETVEITKEKAMKASIPTREIPGIENQYEVNPANTNSPMLNPGTTKVTK